MVDTAASIFRDFVTNGVPSSGPWKPKKPEIRAWGTYVESLTSAAQAGGGVVFTTKASMTLGYNANQIAWVVADTTAANNGIYQKVGASGSGSWTRVADLPYSFVRLTDAGDGTANAIQLTSDLPTSASVMRTANVFEANTGNVTVSENGGTAKPLLTASGNQIAPGGLVAGSIVAYVEVGSNFRLLSDQASAAIQAAAEAAQTAAEAAQAAAEAAAAGVDLPAVAADRMLVDLDLGSGAQRYSRTAAQVRDFLNVPEIGSFSVSNLYNAVTEGGCDNTGATDTSTAVAAAIAAAVAAKKTCHFPEGTYDIGNTRIRIPSDARISGDGPFRTVFVRDTDSNQGTIEVYNATDVQIVGIGIQYTPSTYTLGYAQTGFAVRNGSSHVHLINCGVDGHINRQFHVLNSHDVHIYKCWGVGAGNAGCRIVCDFDANDFTGMSDETSGTVVYNVWVDECYFTGATTYDGTTRSGTSYGVNAATGGTNAGDDIERIFISNSVCRYQTSHGFEASGKGRMISIDNCFAENIVDSVNSTGVGFLLEVANTNYALGSSVRGCNARGCYYGFFETGASFQSFIGCRAYDCTGAGFWNSGGNYNIFDSCIAISCNVGFDCNTSATYILFVACVAVGGSTGFYIRSGTDSVSVNCCSAAGTSVAKYTLSGANMVTIGNTP